MVILRCLFFEVVDPGRSFQNSQRSQRVQLFKGMWQEGWQEEWECLSRIRLPFQGVVPTDRISLQIDIGLVSFGMTTFKHVSLSL